MKNILFFCCEQDHKEFALEDFALIFAEYLYYLFLEAIVPQASWFDSPEMGIAGQKGEKKEKSSIEKRSGKGENFTKQTDVRN